MSLKDEFAKHLTTPTTPTDNFIASIEKRAAEIRSYPPPITTDEAVKKVIRLIGKPMDLVRWCVDAANNWFELNGTMPTADEAIKAYGGLFLDQFTVREIWKDEAFHNACYFRGIRPVGSGLDSRQLMLIASLTNSADRAMLDTKLKRAGVTQLEYQSWLAFPPFRRKLNELSEKAFANATALVNTALTKKALEGSVEAIKLHNQMTGRYDPAAQQAVDVRAFAMGIVQILTKHITDPDLLRTLGGDIALLSAAMGVNTRSDT